MAGGGAAGMMAAAAAARQGAQVLLLERNPKVGRKLYITGKGRCNVTNRCSVQEALSSTPGNGRFLYSAMSRFPPSETEAFFESLGVPLKVERGNRVFPRSDRAADIIDALREELRRLHVTVRQDRVLHLLAGGDGITGAQTERGNLSCGALVLATGGLSYPATGSTGDGYRMARELGHTVVPLRPSLVPLESPDPFCGELQGLKLKNIRLTLKDGKGKIIFCAQGEMEFTPFGVSGPLVLSASACMRSWGPEGCTCVLNLKPALDAETLEARLLRELKAGAGQEMSGILRSMAPGRMVPVLLRRAGIPGDRKGSSVTREERRRLLDLFQNFDIHISGPRPVEEAVVTAGGIRVSEVDPKTMMSRKVPGLFFAGEILDVDAFTGGFNLQIAWATGHAAGEGAAQWVQRNR